MPRRPSNGSGDAVCGSLPDLLAVSLELALWSAVLCVELGVAALLGFEVELWLVEVWSVVLLLCCWLLVALGVELVLLGDWLGVWANAMPTANTITTARINARVLMFEFSPGWNCCREDWDGRPTDADGPRELLAHISEQKKSRMTGKGHDLNATALTLFPMIPIH